MQGQILAKKVKVYLNKTGITQVEFCKRAGLRDRSSLARQLVANNIKIHDYAEKIAQFFEKEGI